MIKISIDRAAAVAMSPVLSFVHPHFEIIPPPDDTSVFIEFLHSSAWARPAGGGDRTLVRRRASGNHVLGRRWRSVSRTSLYVPSSDTAFDFANDGGDARVYVSDSSRYHASDMLRDVMWELAAARGTFIHAAAVCDGYGAIAVVGPKGAGKTTTALDLMHAGCASYAGDVLFFANDRSEAYGFPDYPHVGWGTLRTYPDLLAAATSAGLTPSSDTDKVLLPHDVYQQALGVPQAVPPQALRVVIVPDVRASGPTEIVPTHPRPELLTSMARQTSDPGEGWEPFLTEVRAAAKLAPNRPQTWLGVEQHIPWYARRGAGRLSSEQLRAALSNS